MNFSPALITVALAERVFFTAFFPFFAVTLTVTFAVPFLTPVTFTVFPVAFTVATFLLEEETLTFTFFQLEGVTTLMLLVCFLAEPTATVTVLR